MIRAALMARGQVQGVGFRPFVLRTARDLGLTGWVRNEPGGVRVEAQGDPERVQALEQALHDAPDPVAVTSVAREALDPVSEASFELRPSRTEGRPHPVVPPDLATCPDCLAELDDPASPRFGYALLSCTACGPRYTIARALPFDRERTAMDAFPLCEHCRAEYDEPSDRRFHAQATVCPACGPELRLDGHTGEAAIRDAARRLRRGSVLAIKGLGGFQLLCDATDEAAVQRLREGKRRAHKPLAVLVEDVDALRITDAERQLLGEASAPIVLVDAAVDIAVNVSAGLPWTGILRPTTALHLRLARAVGRPLVCTSGNRSGEPLCRTAEDVRATLPFVDGVLDHDRPVLRAADDSVARVVDGRAVWIRRARGRAPTPVPLTGTGPTVLAVGAHLKNVVGFAAGDQAVLSPHIGTLDGRATLARFEEAIEDLRGVYDVHPDRVACDAHPDLPSTRHAERLAIELDVPLVRVQHHHAHAASVMAEHGLDTALAVVWDGAGYGADGTTWGAEAMLCDGARYERRPMLRRFALPGGDACARSPARCALGVFAGLDGAEPVLARASAALPEGAAAVLARGLARGLFPTATSMGRVFDAVAFACGGPATTDYEAAAAMWLEAMAMRGLDAGERGTYEPDGLLDSVLRDRAAGVAPTRIAVRFHRGLVQLVTDTAREAGLPDVLLAGGCFHNAIILRGARRQLETAGFRVWVSERVPPNDGGLTLGQLWLGRRS